MKFVGEKYTFFSWQPPLSCRLSELNSSPDWLWLYCRVCLQTKSVSGHPQPARTSRAPPCLLPGTLAWPDTSCLSWACVSPGCQQRAECHGTKTSGSSLGHGSSLTPKTRWRVEKHLCNIYVSVYFSGGQSARPWQVCWELSSPAATVHQEWCGIQSNSAQDSCSLCLPGLNPLFGPFVLLLVYQ